MTAESQWRSERKYTLKAVFLPSLALTILALLFSVLYAVKAPLFPEDPPNSELNEENTGSLYYSPAAPLSDEKQKILLRNGDETLELTMSDYLCGAVAAEMPASFDPEALKAQAVAIRTYAMHLLKSPSSAHPDVSVCSDPSCCMAWKPDTYLREKWGSDYEAFSAKIADAVKKTDGQYLTYDGAPALAAFHSSSSGKTESCGEVWDSEMPYLVSVESPETAADVPNFESSVTLSAEEFSSVIQKAHPEAELSGDVSSWIGNITSTASGRIASVMIGGAEIKGTELRSLFSLRSTAVSISAENDAVTLTSAGYGHGVGMSQYGANVMAKRGDTYEEILAWYYPGTELMK